MQYLFCKLYAELIVNISGLYYSESLNGSCKPLIYLDLVFVTRREKNREEKPTKPKMFKLILLAHQ